MGNQPGTPPNHRSKQPIRAKPKMGRDGDSAPTLLCLLKPLNKLHSQKEDTPNVFKQVEAGPARRTSLFERGGGGGRENRPMWCLEVHKTGVSVKKCRTGFPIATPPCNGTVNSRRERERERERETTKSTSLFWPDFQVGWGG